MSTDYFSEREGIEEPQNEEHIEAAFWAGFVALVRIRLSDGSFAEAFPSTCVDTSYPIDCDTIALAQMLQAEHREIADLMDFRAAFGSPVRADLGTAGS